MTEAPHAHERRTTVRNRCLLRGRILFDDKLRTLDCMVRNLSDDGALLEMDAQGAPPAGFTLAIDARGFKRTGVVRWRGVGKVGVTLKGGQRA